MYGEDYDTHDGTCMRDYIHVVDLVDAHILAIEKLKNNGKSSIYNLGGRFVKVDEALCIQPKKREETRLRFTGQID